MTAGWRPNLALTKVGNGTLAFSTANDAVMTFSIDGVAGSKAITRQIFATAPVVQLPGGFPFTFTGSPTDNPIRTVRLNSITFQSNAVTGICSATLLFTNTSAVSISPSFHFNVVVGGITTSQLIFGSANLVPGATASDTNIVLSNGSLAACGTFELQFNTVGSRIFSP